MLDMDLNIVAWNIRGLGKVTKQNEVKNLMMNEKLSICAILETHMKKSRIDKVCMNVFGSWSWQNNKVLSRKGCRLALGWDNNHVNYTLINATSQAMLYMVEVLNPKRSFYCTFIYAANKGKDKRELRKELSLNKRIVGSSAWIIMGDVKIEMEDINCSGFHFTWTKSLLNPNATILKKIDRIIDLPIIFTDKEEFKVLMKEKWKIKVTGYAMYRLVKKLKSLKPYLNKLSWKNRNLFEKVKELKAKLNNVQGRIDKDPTNKALRDESIDVLSEYKEAVMDEEKLLRHKTKIAWLKEGDKNSAYFHKVLKGRLNRSRIMSICAEDGKRYDNFDVAYQFVKYFQGFLGISHDVTKLEDIEGTIFDNKVSIEEANQMTKDVIDEEIKKALFDIDDNKAPGLDGFTSKFYKKAWDIVKDDFYNAIKEFFNSGKMLGAINATLISLVPKSMTPQNVSDFRPIACCNVVYKCISKILTNRIKSALTHLVDDNQSAFIPGRAIIDNILLTQELLKGYNCVNGPKRCSFKIDIQKAYYWEIDCKRLNTVSISHIVDLDLFKLTIVLQRLYRSKTKDLHDILKKFSFIDVRTASTLMDTKKPLLKDSDGDDVDVYLYRYLKGQPKLGLWYHRDSSFDLVAYSNSDYARASLDRKSTTGGRAQLIASVLGSMQVYWGSVFLLPKAKAVVIDIEKLFKRYLWNSGESCKGKAKVAWKDVCKPKDQGGLGFKSLEVWNKTLLVKHLWNVASKKEPL
ncbi:RNA-directed DNA polymerase, eukaryota, reverse transcriptase zinc-binding domain protein [Tanacetum coccineum]